jgi:hypothetical protein
MRRQLRIHRLKEFQVVGPLYFTFMEQTRTSVLMSLAVKTIGYP